MQSTEQHRAPGASLQPAVGAGIRHIIAVGSGKGDVNRNVMSAANPNLSKVHKEAYDLACKISPHLLPKTGAYHEIWLDGEKVEDKSGKAEANEEPIYGGHYLPRKFKTVVAVPPDNDVDIFAHDLGFITIVENSEVVGYNVTVGGGMAMTHGETDTFPRTADILGFCTPEQAVDVAEKVVTVQRDWAIGSFASARASSTRSRTGGSPPSVRSSRSGSAISSASPGPLRSNRPAT